MHQSPRDHTITTKLNTDGRRHPRGLKDARLTPLAALGHALVIGVMLALHPRQHLPSSNHNTRSYLHRSHTSFGLFSSRFTSRRYSQHFKEQISFDMCSLATCLLATCLHLIDIPFVLLLNYTRGCQMQARFIRFNHTQNSLSYPVSNSKNSTVRRIESLVTRWFTHQLPAHEPSGHPAADLDRWSAFRLGSVRIFDGQRVAICVQPNSRDSSWLIHAIISHHSRDIHIPPFTLHPHS